ncbi:MAG: O-methyltransferase [Rhizomicrobium sp.]
MTKLWRAVDDYYTSVLGASDPVMEEILARSRKADLPDIQVSPLQGRMLMLLAQAMGARRILEIGTLGGYSTVWMARALPGDGRLVTLEYQPSHAQVARANIARAGFASQVEVRIGAGRDSMRALIEEKARPFDFIFIDADKPGYPLYLDLALKLARPGTLILADNMVREGKVADPENKDEGIRAAREFNEMLAANPRLAATAIQTVGQKGHDGFVLARVIGES